MITAIPLFSSSSGNSFYIKYKNEELLIDAGVSYRMLKNRLNDFGTDISNISKVFVTHEHTDHIKALEMICKNKKTQIIINSRSANAINYEKFENAHCCFDIKNAGESFFTDGLSVDIFKTPHDSMGSVGYRITADDGDTLGYATDIGMITKGLAKSLLGCKTVVIESNHDVEMLKNGSYPYYTKVRILSDHGHLSNEACGRFLPSLVESGTQRIWLAHLSHQNNTPRKAYFSARDALLSGGIKESDIQLGLAEGDI